MISVFPVEKPEAVSKDVRKFFLEHGGVNTQSVDW